MAVIKAVSEAGNGGFEFVVGKPLYLGEDGKVTIVEIRDFDEEGFYIIAGKEAADGTYHTFTAARMLQTAVGVVIYDIPQSLKSEGEL